ncbi:siderophore-interacting protein [Nocardioides bruguierae]|uniref:Siderophore-interacting protein n=1 Tax=Nocardioides bruguierae TaxID=2945102 RepID=A0A9X2D947_9ACTN|nr:siderophore-interacting protein [Nocardioides bruguierae]MCM0620339.1 siderophore-interacting protein [Nocardioides bruguierae]
MTAAPETDQLPFLITECVVTRADRLTPSFVRVELASPDLAEFGTGGPLYDQRIKLVFPHPDGPMPQFSATGEEPAHGWYAAWSALPERERGYMRTYTVRALRGSGADTRLVVDLVVHGTDGHGEAGPGSRWAAEAREGSRVAIVGPRRGHHTGGIEFDPGTAARLLLAGDETAVPAVLATLELLPDDATGVAVLEVPDGRDAQDVAAPAGVELVWLPRDGHRVGERLHAEVLARLGHGLEARDAAAAGAVLDAGDVEDNVWETPQFSSSGEAVDQVVAPSGETGLDDLYAWIAGESRMVTGLRRALVKDLGLDRRQVAFMGYWREGVAMRG